jgi:hypothetical protein
VDEVLPGAAGVLPEAADIEPPDELGDPDGLLLGARYPWVGEMVAVGSPSCADVPPVPGAAAGVVAGELLHAAVNARSAADAAMARARRGDVKVGMVPRW